jgi:dTDP-4-amino-4,6-dideoxygalactose transaminase
LASRLRLLRSHGITRDPGEMTRAPDGPWYYQQIALGFNYRMTDIQAALGLSQMQRLRLFVARRQAIASRYDELLSDTSVVTPWQHPEGSSAWHLYVIRLRQARRKVFDALRAAGIGANVHYIPVHRQPFYARLGFKAGDWPEAERYYDEAVSLPMYSEFTAEQQDQVVAALLAAARQ